MDKNNYLAILETVEKIYEWSTSAEGLNVGLSSTGGLLESSKALLMQLSWAEGSDFVIAEVGMGRKSAEEMLNSRNSPGNFLRHCQGWDQDNVYDAARLHSADDSSATKFSEKILEPNKIGYSVAGVVSRNQVGCIVLCCYRSANEPSYTDRDLRTLSGLLPHWRRAIEVKSRIEGMNIQSQATHRILDHAPFSILLVNSAAQVLYMNYSARVGADAADGIAISENCLRFANPDNRRKFLGLLVEAGQLKQDSTGTSPIMMAIERPSGAKPYQLMILPVQNAEEAGIATGSTYAVFIYDPMVNLPVDTDALCMLEGLTQSEAKLCSSLYKTKSLGATARQLDVSMSTAKTHLLNTFRKLGINSQAELMQYLAHMPKASVESRH